MDSGLKRDKETPVPIACFLPQSELADRAQAWETLLRTSLLARERVAGGLRLTVHAGALSSLRELVDLERDCCPWITFSFDGEHLTMTASGAGEETLVQMFS
jgi:hypothetical protein